MKKEKDILELCNQIRQIAFDLHVFLLKQTEKLLALKYFTTQHL